MSGFDKAVWSMFREGLTAPDGPPLLLESTSYKPRSHIQLRNSDI